MGLQKDILGPPSRSPCGYWTTIRRKSKAGEAHRGWLAEPVREFVRSTPTIPGTVPPHAVTVHPSPDQYVAVSWKSPLEGSVHVETKVADAHAGCGNGVAWWLDALRSDSGPTCAAIGWPMASSMMAKPRPSPRAICKSRPAIFSVSRSGPAIETRLRLTLVDLTIKEIGGKERSWNLAADVADTVLAANPHADRLGNKDVWQSRAAGTTVPRSRASMCRPVRC